MVFNDDDSTPVIISSLVEGGRPDGAVEWNQGVGILTDNPLFVRPQGPDSTAGTIDDDLRLQDGSPAIDAGLRGEVPVDFLDYDGNGSMTSEPLPVDLAYRQRIVDGGSGSEMIDLGAYEHGAPPLRVGVETAAEQPGSHVLTAPHPNPFATQASFQFTVPERGDVQVMLYDALGRTVRVLYEGRAAPNRRYTIELDGSDLPSGTYFVHLVGEGVQQARPVVVVE